MYMDIVQFQQTLKEIEAICEGEPQKALDMADAALENISSDQPELKVDFLAARAQAFNNLGRYREALDTSFLAQELAQKIDHDQALPQLFKTMGHACGNLDDLPLALDYYRKMLDASRRVGDRTNEANALLRIGVVYSDMGQYEKALEHYALAYPIYEELGERLYLGHLNLNSSIEANLLERYEEAIEYSRKALELYQTMAPLYPRISAIINMAFAYAKSGDSEVSQEQLIKARNLVTELDQPPIIMRLTLRLGQVYNLLAQPDKAIEQLEVSLNIAFELDSLVKQYECHQELAEAYKQLGDFETALYHHRTFYQLYKQVNSEQQQRRFENLAILHETEEAKREAERQREIAAYLERLNEMKNDTINVLSHDLKNPLSTILLQATLLDLNKRTDDAKGQLYLNRIKLSVTKMRDLLVDLLDLARLETGQSLNIRRQPLKPLLEQAIYELDPLARAQGITLEPPQQVPDTDIPIDSLRMRQVLDNLLSNAIKYNRAGGHVSIDNQLSDTHVEITVKDTGIGIPPEALPHLFERFYRVHDERHQSVEGSGLGLAICKAIVEQHRGSIQVDSTPNVGTSFVISLPLH
ncbi:MAG: tetratricopeptide repeat-containing sensor histidine kinase [Chloroflexi bacterium]|nr:tetratricopeptide repeat-containing sensor histidine kinase [Chloroflexota bacterium]